MSEEFNVVCGACDVEFNIAYNEDEGELQYCPFCGDELIEELDFEE